MNTDQVSSGLGQTCKILLEFPIIPLQLVELCRKLCNIIGGPALFVVEQLNATSENSLLFLHNSIFWLVGSALPKATRRALGAFLD